MEDTKGSTRCAHFLNGPDTLGVVYQSNERAWSKQGAEL